MGEMGKRGTVNSSDRRCMFPDEKKVRKTTTVAQGSQDKSLFPERGEFWGSPIKSLKLSPQQVHTMKRMGLHTVADLLRVGHRYSRVLGDRLGREVEVAFHTLVKQTDNEEKALYDLPSTSFVIERSGEFEEGVVLSEALLGAVRPLVKDALRELRQKDMCGKSYSLELKGKGRTQLKLYAQLFNITTENSVMDSFRLGFEAEPPCFAVLGFRLLFSTQGHIRQQWDLFDAPQAMQQKIERGLAQLKRRCGEKNVGSPVLGDHYRCDDVEMQPFRYTTKQSPENSCLVSFRLSLRRFRPPIRVRVGWRNNQAMRLDGLNGSGRIVGWRGPFKRRAHWWEPDGGVHCHFYDASLADERCFRLCYNIKDQKWTALGIYD
jgi:hypothetical protein